MFKVVFLCFINTLHATSRDTLFEYSCEYVGERALRVLKMGREMFHSTPTPTRQEKAVEITMPSKVRGDCKKITLKDPIPSAISLRGVS